MKKFMSVLVMLFIMSVSIYGEQYVKVYSNTKQSSIEVSELIQEMISCGWKVVSMVSVSSRKDIILVDSGVTTSIIVVYEKIEC